MSGLDRDLHVLRIFPRRSDGESRKKMIEEFSCSVGKDGGDSDGTVPRAGGALLGESEIR